jgi:hypothetical protein
MDHYIKTGDNNIHMANIIYAWLLIVAGMALLIFLLQRALNKDFAKIELIDTKRKQNKNYRQDEDQVGLKSNNVQTKAEDVCWKKISGDVFRKPDFTVMFCLFLGMGVQVLVYMYLMLFLCTFGIIVPQFRANLGFQYFLSMQFGGFGNGYVTARTLKYFGSSEWRFSASIAALVLPVYMIITFLLVDFIEYFEKSEQRFPLTSIAIFCGLWLVMNVPMSYAGAYFAFTNSDDKPNQVS